MDFALDLIANVSRWCRGHLSDIALAIMATVLVLAALRRLLWRRCLPALSQMLRVHQTHQNCSTCRSRSPQDMWR